jgi:hypothetical protein
MAYAPASGIKHHRGQSGRSFPRRVRRSSTCCQILGYLATTARRCRSGRATYSGGGVTFALAIGDLEQQRSFISLSSTRSTIASQGVSPLATETPKTPLATKGVLPCLVYAYARLSIGVSYGRVRVAAAAVPACCCSQITIYAQKWQAHFHWRCFVQNLCA